LGGAALAEFLQRADHLDLSSGFIGFEGAPDRGGVGRFIFHDQQT
jgi:hypothetical protein